MPAREILQINQCGVSVGARGRWEFFRAVVEQRRKLRLLSDEHFTVDGH
jgi:hypothetical protein